MVSSESGNFDERLECCICWEKFSDSSPPMGVIQCLSRGCTKRQCRPCYVKNSTKRNSCPYCQGIIELAFVDRSYIKSLFVSLREEVGRAQIHIRNSDVNISDLIIALTELQIELGLFQRDCKWELAHKSVSLIGDIVGGALCFFPPTALAGVITLGAKGILFDVGAGTVMDIVHNGRKIKIKDLYTKIVSLKTSQQFADLAISVETYCRRKDEYVNAAKLFPQSEPVDHPYQFHISTNTKVSVPEGKIGKIQLLLMKGGLVLNQVGVVYAAGKGVNSESTLGATLTEGMKTIQDKGLGRCQLAFVVLGAVVSAGLNIYAICSAYQNKKLAADAIRELGNEIEKLREFNQYYESLRGAL